MESKQIGVINYLTSENIEIRPIKRILSVNNCNFLEFNLLILEHIVKINNDSIYNYESRIAEVINESDYGKDEIYKILRELLRVILLHRNKSLMDKVYESIGMFEYEISNNDLCENLLVYISINNKEAVKSLSKDIYDIKTIDENDKIKYYLSLCSKSPDDVIHLDRRILNEDISIPLLLVRKNPLAAIKLRYQDKNFYEFDDKKKIMEEALKFAKNPFELFIANEPLVNFVETSFNHEGVAEIMYDYFTKDLDKLCEYLDEIKNNKKDYYPFKVRKIKWGDIHHYYYAINKKNQSPKAEEWKLVGSGVSGAARGIFNMARSPDNDLSNRRHREATGSIDGSTLLTNNFNSMKTHTNYYTHKLDAFDGVNATKSAMVMGELLKTDIRFVAFIGYKNFEVPYIKKIVKDEFVAAINDSNRQWLFNYRFYIPPDLFNEISDDLAELVRTP